MTKLQESRRGRPRKHGVNETEAVQARRVRMRYAQEAFRSRKKAMQEAEKQRLSYQEGVIETMSSAFMDFFDVALRSESVRKDKAVMESLHRTIERFVLANTPDNSVEHETIISSNTDMTAIEATKERNSLEVDDIDAISISERTHFQGTKQIDSLERPFDCHSNLLPTSVLSASQSSPHIGHDQIFPENIFGNGWLDQLPESLTWLQNNQRSDEMDPSPFSLKLLQYTLNTAYQALNGSPNIPIEDTLRIFQFALLFHHKDEILFNLRWFLGPGSQEIARLASVKFAKVPTEYTGARSLMPAVDIHACQKMSASHGSCHPFVNAQGVEQYLREKGARFLDSELIQISLPHSLASEFVPNSDSDVISPSSLTTKAPHDPPMGNSSVQGSLLSNNTSTHSRSKRQRVSFGLWDFFSLKPLLGKLETTSAPIRPSPFTKSAEEQANHEDSQANTTYSIRSSVLFRNLVSISLCLTSGPGYNRKYIDQAIRLSIIGRANSSVSCQ